ncbi:hypothetical protein DPMN_122046 [Dreissena polymorpha]|uniref:Uncharacterized protein n=1 Tax=Dreissena polymorpha TaxID=45954 RepID=A0A9D4GNM5_DREPO|nr:hypothetical protein DPMN_122046 [Dreissena polymorpha]
MNRIPVRVREAENYNGRGMVRGDNPQKGLGFGLGVGLGNHEFDIRAPHKGKKGTISNLGCVGVFQRTQNIPLPVSSEMLTTWQVVGDIQ